VALALAPDPDEHLRTFKVILVVIRSQWVNSLFAHSQREILKESLQFLNGVLFCSPESPMTQVSGLMHNKTTLLASLIWMDQQLPRNEKQLQTSSLMKRTAQKKLQLPNYLACIIVLDTCPSRSCKKWPNERCHQQDWQSVTFLHVLPVSAARQQRNLGNQDWQRIGKVKAETN